MDTKKTIFIFGKARLPDCKFGKKYIQLNKNIIALLIGIYEKQNEI